MALGDDPYRFPHNLPVVGAKGGPGGKPGCGSLPDVAQNWPVRQLVTNTGFGTGVDWRPNPGIAFPTYANFLPVTRAVPEPPSIRNLFGGPAPGPIPYPGAPAYGAPMYAPRRHPAVAGTAARTASWRTEGSRSEAGYRAVHRARTCAAATDPVAADSGPAGRSRHLPEHPAPRPDD